MNQRVLKIEFPSIETSLFAHESINGVRVKDILTCVERPTNTKGIFHCKSIGVVTNRESKIGAYSGEGIGRVNT